MSLFGKKKDLRFESITVDRQSEIFRGLEQRGWTMIQDTFQFDLEKPPEKIRKMAVRMAKDMKAELLVEVWDPIYMKRPFRGLTYAAFRKMTPEEINRKKIEEMRKKKQERPRYGSMNDPSKMIRQQAPSISEEDLKALEQIMEEEHISPEELIVKAEEKGEYDRSTSIKALSAKDPLDRQGQYEEDELDKEAEDYSGPRYKSAPEYTQGESTEGPVFEKSMEIKTIDDIETADIGEDFDAMSVMIDAGSQKDEDSSEDDNGEKDEQSSG